MNDWAGTCQMTVRCCSLTARQLVALLADLFPLARQTSKYRNTSCLLTKTRMTRVSSTCCCCCSAVTQLTPQPNSGPSFGVASFLPLRQSLHRPSPLYQHLHLSPISHLLLPTSAPLLPLRSHLHNPLNFARNDPAESPTPAIVPAYRFWGDEGTNLGGDGIG